MSAKSTSTPTVIARSVERESFSDDGVWWWTEYRTRKITSDDYYRLHLDAPFQDWLLEKRYLCRLPGGRVVAKFPQGELAEATRNPIDPEDAWEPWALGASETAVIWDMLGDSRFAEATSLAEVHRRLVETLRALAHARADAQAASDAEYAARERVRRFELEESRKFSKKHGAKTGDAFERAKAKALARVGPELERLHAEVTRLAEEAKGASQRLAEEQKAAKAAL